MVDKKSEKILCTIGCEGKRHDFQLLKDSKVRFQKGTVSLEDSGYQGIDKIHSNALIPKKKSKKKKLSKQERLYNKMLSSQRVFVENVIAYFSHFL